MFIELLKDKVIWKEHGNILVVVTFIYELDESLDSADEIGE